MAGAGSTIVGSTRPSSASTSTAPARRSRAAPARRRSAGYTGRVSAHTRRLLVEHGGFRYDSDAYDAELPYWLGDAQRAHLVIPYTLLHNDVRYVTSPGCAHADDFFTLLRDGFDRMWVEGAQRPRMMSVGLHSRFSGHPARAVAIARFLDHVAAHDRVWVCRRRDIAEHWHRNFGPPAPQLHE